MTLSPPHLSHVTTTLRNGVLSVSGRTSPTTTWTSTTSTYRRYVEVEPTRERMQNFSRTHLPSQPNTIILGDLNAHHEEWDDSSCVVNDRPADNIGRAIYAWMEANEWTCLNDGSLTYTSRASGSRTAPDVSLAHPGFLGCAHWSVGPALGSDHATVIINIEGPESTQQLSRQTKWSFQKADWEN